MFAATRLDAARLDRPVQLKVPLKRIVDAPVSYAGQVVADVGRKRGSVVHLG